MRIVHVHSPLVAPRVPRRALVGLVAAGSLAFGVASADAHTQVVSTSPSAGGTASTSVRRVTVTFGSEFRHGTLKVTRGGRRVSFGKARKDPKLVRRLVVGLRSGLRPGRYKATWSVRAFDNHHQTGSFTFLLRNR